MQLYTHWNGMYWNILWRFWDSCQNMGKLLRNTNQDIMFLVFCDFVSNYGKKKWKKLQKWQKRPKRPKWQKKGKHFFCNIPTKMCGKCLEIRIFAYFGTLVAKHFSYIFFCILVLEFFPSFYFIFLKSSKKSKKYANIRICEHFPRILMGSSKKIFFCHFCHFWPNCCQKCKKSKK